MSNRAPKRVPHAIDYIELPSLDLAASKAFYAAAFDWRFNNYGPSYAGFVDGARGEQEAGGLCVVEEVGAGGALVVLYAEDLEASRDRVVEAGGVLTKDIFEFPGGRRFQFNDPSGLELAVWCPRG